MPLNIYEIHDRWISEAVEQPASIICPRSTACPRPVRCADLASISRTEEIGDVRRQIIEEAVASQ